MKVILQSGGKTRTLTVGEWKDEIKRNTKRLAEIWRTPLVQLLRREWEIAETKLHKGPEHNKRVKQEAKERAYAKYGADFDAYLRDKPTALQGPNPIATAVKVVAEKNGVNERTIRRATTVQRQRITKEVEP